MSCCGPPSLWPGTTSPCQCIGHTVSRCARLDFPISRLTSDQHDSTVAGLHLLPAPHQQRDLFLRTCGHSPARMQLTTRNLARLRELYKNLAISQRELDQAASDQQTARQSAGGVASKRRAYPGPRRRGHSPTTRLRSRNVIRARSRLLL